MTKTMVKDDPHNDSPKDHALIRRNQTETCNIILLSITGDNFKTILETLCKSPLNMKMLFSISWQ